MSDAISSVYHHNDPQIFALIALCCVIWQWPAACAFSPHLGSTISTFRTSKCTTSTTALNGNLIDRFTRVAKANVNNSIKSWEDPEKGMNQALIDMQVRTVVLLPRNSPTARSEETHGTVRLCSNSER
jgi:hypothetical protein